MLKREQPSTGTVSASFPQSPHCPHFQKTAELIGKRWTAAILRTLMTGSKRFGEIADAIPGLSHRLLAERLKDLIAASIVEERRSDQVYRLTTRGSALKPILAEIEAWNMRWGPASDAAVG